MSYPSPSAAPITGPALDLASAHPALLLFDVLTAGVSHELAEGAHCGYDPQLHTGPDAFTDESPDDQAAREQVAREVCAECPVRALCLDRALTLRPETGVWAGLLADEIGALSLRHSATDIEQEVA
ncbi:WhiB family transcriptional regulator [Streptosporangium subroseum]|uniref:WhiB family transcriptional regulator n=1 Tax=Streptosporangium subroseum TaxID=106412 RepID=UPI003434D89B